MNTVSTDKPINVGQLSAELGGAPLQLHPATGPERAVTCLDDSVTEEQLEAAIDAHDAQPEPEPGPPEPPSPTLEEIVAQLRQQVGEQAAAIEEQYAVQDELITMILGG